MNPRQASLVLGAFPVKRGIRRYVNRRALATALLAASFFTSLTLAARAETVSGRAVALDGDTITIGQQTISLLGIDAPEAKQVCWNALSEQWPCGKQAAAVLTGEIRNAIISCEGTHRDHAKRLLAVCRLGSTNINAWLVEQGWALAYRPQSTAFVHAEESARGAGLGLWAGAFEPPWLWRIKNEGGSAQFSSSAPPRAQ